MFDPITAALLRTAPALPELNPATLPQMLTARYAELVARRLRRIETAEVVEPSAGEGEPSGEERPWPLTRIADAYELVASIHDDPDIRRAAAFVAGTAQQILAQESAAASDASVAPILDRDRVDPALAASILFLAAEQYADANEAAQRIRITDGQQDYVATLLAEDIRDLAVGNLGGIIERARGRPEHFTSRGGLEDRGMTR